MPLLDDRTGRPYTGQVVLPFGDDGEGTQVRPPPVFLSAMRQFNSAVAVAENIDRMASARDARSTSPEFRIDRDYDTLAGYEEFDDAFVFARNMHEVEQIKARIDREKLDRRNIQANGAHGVIAALAAGVLDPINFVSASVFGPKLIEAGSKALKARVIAEAALSTAAAETVLQTQLETMTAEESAYAIAGSAFLAGLIPARLLSAARRTKLVQDLEAATTMPRDGDFDPVNMNRSVNYGGGAPPPPGDGGAGVEGLAPRPERRSRFKQHFGEGLIDRQSAANRITSGSFDDELAKEVGGIVEQAGEIPGNVEEALETVYKSIEQGQLSHALEIIDKMFLRHRGDPRWNETGVLRTRPIVRSGLIRAQDFLKKHSPWHEVDGDVMDHLTFRREVGRALRKGDVQDARPGVPRSPEVDEAARTIRKYFDDYMKRGQEAGLIEGIEGYFPRVYNREMIELHGREFVRKAYRAIRHRHPDIEPETALSVARRVRHNILNDPHYGAEFDGIAVNFKPKGKTSAMQSRKFHIADSELDGSSGGQNFLIDDVETVLHGYHRRFVPDLLLAERWGVTNVDQHIDKLKRELNARYAELERAAEGAAKLEIRSQWKQDLEDFQAILDIFRHRYRLPGTESGIGEPTARVFRAMRAYNTSRIGGGFALAAIPDIGRPVMMHGTKQVYGDIVENLVDRLKRAKFKLTLEEADAFGLAGEITIGSRAAVIADSGELQGSLRLSERFLDNAVTTTLLSTGLLQWNSMAKRMSAVVAQSRIISVAKKALAGEALDARDSALMTRLNLTGADFVHFIDRFNEYGEMVGKAHWAHVSDWPVDNVSRKFIAAVRKDVDTVIVTPGIADLPNMMQREGWARMILQFKSFGLASMNRTVRTGLQSPDMDKLHGLSMMMAGGLFVYAAKEMLKDEQTRFRNTDPIALAWEAVDRSGGLGYLGDVHNSLQRVSGNRVSLQRLFGSSAMSSRGTRPNVLGTIFGPSADLINSTAVAGNALLDRFAKGKPLSSYEKGQIQRLLPFQNLWHARLLWGTAAAALPDQEPEEEEKKQ